MLLVKYSQIHHPISEMRTDWRNKLPLITLRGKYNFPNTNTNTNTIIQTQIYFDKYKYNSKTIRFTNADQVDKNSHHHHSIGRSLKSSANCNLNISKPERAEQSAQNLSQICAI